MCTCILKVTQLAFSCWNSTIQRKHLFKVMLLCEECSINSCGQSFSKITEKKLNVENAVHCSKIRLFIYQFSGTIVSWLKEVFWFLSFVVDFRKVPKHFLRFNTDESISTMLIKNESLLYFSRVCQIAWVAWVAGFRW